MAALGHPLFSVQELTEKSFEVEFGQTLFQEDLVDYLMKAGYEPSALVREQGEFAKRGAIIDVFPPSSAKPVRIEFLGDQVYSLRFFDPASQRSQRRDRAVGPDPCQSFLPHGSTIMDYLPAGAVVVHRGLDELCLRIEEAGIARRRSARVTCSRSLLNIDVSGVRGEEEGEVLEAVVEPGLEGGLRGAEGRDIQAP